MIVNMMKIIVLALMALSVVAFRPQRMRKAMNVLQMSDEVDSAAPPASKGFGKAKAAVKSDGDEPAEISAGDRTYLSQAKRGVPEYNIFIRPKNGTDEEWVPVGSMTIPRDTPVGKAVYDVEGELLKGTFKLYPKLKAFSDVRSEEDRKDMWEYGSTLKAFPDEPITLIGAKDDVTAEITGQNGNFFTNWVKSITSPVDNSGINNPGQGTLKQ